MGPRTREKKATRIVQAAHAAHHQALTSVVAFILISVLVTRRTRAMTKLSIALGVIICPVCNQNVFEKVKLNFEKANIARLVHCVYQGCCATANMSDKLCDGDVVIITREQWQKEYSQ